MSLDADNVSLFVEGRAGAAFVLWLCVGIGVAAAAALLLPWPPGVGDAAMAAVVFAVCGAVAWQVGGQREVFFDRAAKAVVDRRTLAGVPRERRLVLADGARVEVTQTIIKVARPGTDSGHRTSSDYDHRPHFRLSLRSGSKVVALDLLPDVLEAERRAREVAAVCAVPAVRSGYAIDRHDEPGPPAAAAPRAVARVRTAAGAESPILAAR